MTTTTERDPEEGLTDEELLARGLPTRDEAAQLIQDRLGAESRFADWLATAELVLVELIRRSSDDPKVQRRRAGIAAEHFQQLALFGLPERQEAGAGG